jgi:protein SCO1/2
VKFDQKLDAQLPADAMFKDDTGKTVRLGDYFGERPVVLAFVYSSARCSVTRS